GPIGQPAVVAFRRPGAALAGFRLACSRPRRSDRDIDAGTLPMNGKLPVTIADIRRAEAAIAGAMSRTPIARAPALSEITGCEVFLKLETLQATGSFKERGALNKLLSLDKPERRAGVVAMSAGNH